MDTNDHTFQENGFKPPQPVTGLFFNLNHLSPSQGYFLT